MKFKVSRSALYNKLQALNRVLNNKNTLPILDCYLFDIKGTQMTITASDSESSLISSLELIEAEYDARFCIKAKVIQDTLREIADQPLTIDINLDTQEIRGDYLNGFFQIVGERADEYPAPPALADDRRSYSIGQSVLLSGINGSIFALADEEIRPVMTGIYCDFTPDCLVFVGTDGRKLVRKKNFDVKSNEQVGFILPKKPANILKSLLPKDDAPCQLSFDQRLACVEAPDFTLTCRLIDGRYPNYNSVIPQNNPYAATIDRLSLISALKRVMVQCDQASALVKLQFTQGQLTLSGQDINYSTRGEETVPCQYADNDIRIGFKATLLLDILNSLECTEIVMQLADPGRAGLIMPAEQKPNEEVLLLLMPMMLND